jgi:hypothetical protein
MAHDHRIHQPPRLVRATALPQPGARARASRVTMTALAGRLLETFDEPRRARAQ